MRRLIITVMLAMLTMPAFCREKAPKSEKVNNVILIIGDGMGLSHAASYMIDLNYAPVCFDRAQFCGIVKTYSNNNRATDSAAAATALATGHKTDNGRLGTLPDGSAPVNMGELAKGKGLGVGIVVTSYVLDATLGGFYAHVDDRKDRAGIISDLFEFRPDVLVGGGKKYFTEEKYVKEDMTKKAVELGFSYVETPEDFYKTTATPILGLFSDDIYPMAIDRDSDFLKDAMEHTLSILETNKKGFFAMIEGSKIDYAAHSNNAEELTFEMEEFDKAVNAAFDYADTHKGTLVIVTADHETGGLTLVPGDRDYTKGDTGVETRWSTTGHSASPVPVYSYGASAWKFSGVMDNTDIFKRIKEVLIDK